jgi:hypothetical protein
MERLDRVEIEKKKEIAVTHVFVPVRYHSIQKFSALKELLHLYSFDPLHKWHCKKIGKSIVYVDFAKEKKRAKRM